MGIMYKLMKHRNLNMDFNESPPLKATNFKSERNRLITIEGNIIEAPLLASSESLDDNSAAVKDSSMDKQFTAEHIIQLCKFLAEKSKRNKNLYRQQQSPKKLAKNKQTQFSFHAMECDNNNDNDDDEMEFYQNEALPLLSKQRLELQEKAHVEYEKSKNEESAVLATRLSPDINSLNISLNTTAVTSCALQHQQQQQQHIYNYSQQQQPQPTQSQEKRDILLKIRRQIFERKRLRENGPFEPQVLNNSQVWRPW